MLIDAWMDNLVGQTDSLSGPVVISDVEQNVVHPEQHSGFIPAVWNMTHQSA